MSEPIFRSVQAEDVPCLLRMCRCRAELTEVYTSLLVCGETPYIGSLWVCMDEHKEICGFAFDNGSYTVYHTPEKTRFVPFAFSPAAFFQAHEQNDLIFMAYSRNIPMPSASRQSIEEIHGKSLADIYKLASCEAELSDCNEKRYLYNYLCFNRGISRSFGIYGEHGLISTASITAANEEYALIANVFTLPLRRGEGLASALLSAAVKAALSRELTPVLVCEKRLVGFYEREGFGIYGQRL